MCVYVRIRVGVIRVCACVVPHLDPRDGVVRHAVDLWDAAERVGVLHGAAILVRVRDGRGVLLIVQ